MLVSLTSYFPEVNQCQMTCSNGPAMLDANTPLAPLQRVEVGRNVYLYAVSFFR